MAQECFICHKGTQVGGGYSNRTRATKYNTVGKKRRYPNLQFARLASGRRAKICTRCIKKGKNLTAR